MPCTLFSVKILFSNNNNYKIVFLSHYLDIELIMNIITLVSMFK
jgi:hypothetical protein